MTRTTRRRFLVAAGGAGAALAGCAASSGPSSPEPTATPTPEPDAVLEYSVTTGKSPEPIPDDIADVHRGADNPDGRREEGNVWVVVDVTVVKGTLDMSDAWFHSRIETEDRYYEPDHASDMFPGGLQPRGAVKAGSSVVVLFQVPEGTDVVRWFIEGGRSSGDYAVREAGGS